ncbi:hypothetical protein DNG35_10685 [Mesonia sp. K7]|nr:hypothetical protein DNG35_10685 [Mesonia sp. K7]
MFTSCSNDDDNGTPPVNNCDFDTIISDDLYANAPSDQLSITDLSILDDCLQITFSASGCDGNSWVVKLIDSGEISDSSPAQRDLRLSLENNEACTAVPSKTYTFDISELQIPNDSEVNLNITNSDDQILYEY